MFDNVFVQIGLILGLAAFAGALAQLLRQPLIVAFIAIGILLGPSAWGVVAPNTEIELFARLGIALLLFIVGLKLDPHIIRTVGPVALASGLGQVLFTSVAGYLLALLLGMSHVTAIYVAVALTFSSTIIIVKLLSDKREVDALHGRIAVGFLIVQDIVVVLVMIGLTAFGRADAETHMGWEALQILLKGAAMLLIGLGRYGAALAANLRERGSRLLAVDFDPTTVQRHLGEGYRVHYGDAEDPELLATLPLAQVRWVVNTIRDRSINRLLLQSLRQHNYRGKVAVATSSHQDAQAFEQDGVDLVLIPYADAAREAAVRLMPSPAERVPVRGEA